MTKENVFTCWKAFQALSALIQSRIRDAEDVASGLMHPALKSAFEAAYSPKPPGHRDLITINFGDFFRIGLGEEYFTRLMSLIRQRSRTLVRADTMKHHWAASQGTQSRSLETPETSEGSGQENQQSRTKSQTYNTEDSQVVTDPSTDSALCCLYMGERTGSLVFSRMWSYVIVHLLLGHYISNMVARSALDAIFGATARSGPQQSVSAPWTRPSLCSGTKPSSPSHQNYSSCFIL